MNTVITSNTNFLMLLSQFVFLIFINFGAGTPVFAQDKTVPLTKRELIFPGLLKKEELDAGNPLATYAAMLELEKEYLNSKIFAGIYPEVRFNFEEFLGFPLAGLKAMQLPNYRRAGMSGEDSIPKSFKPRKALDIIEQEAQKTRIVIWAEEHHLPQTRSLYEELLKRLRKQGYRYLAAETFADEVTDSDFKYPDYESGYYTRDPVFSSAVRSALKLGYKLIAYDTSERGPAGDASFRDRKQAFNLKERIFDRDPQAKVLILVGRGHASEETAPDGWTPMASVLKKTTGINPFTIYSPTMNQRLTAEDEHPLYRFATANNLVKQPTIFVNEARKEFVKPQSLDAYVFFPKVTIVQGRPDWMIREMGRRKVDIPKKFLDLIGKERLLVQAFEQNEPDSAIPVDQVLISEREVKVLMLPKGEFRLRAIDKSSRVFHQETIRVD
jgi:hypothetical protein